MKNINKTSAGMALLTLILGVGLGWFLFSNPNRDPATTHMHADGSTNEDWTCSMHPQIRQKEAGNCPLCGMALIPVASGDSEDADPLSVKMSATAMQLASVQTQVVARQKPVKTLRLNGKVQPDERLVSTQTTHIAGRIEKLLINTTGEYVAKGQTIAYIYSPDLVTAQEELFEAQIIAESNPLLFKAAKDKLKNWKLTDDQIADILASGVPAEEFPILSGINGIVLNKQVNLGDHVMSGTPLFEIANLSRVWVLFDVYESDLSWVKKGDVVDYTIQSLPGEKFKGKITFIDPVMNAKTRVAKARIVSANKSAKLKPEMFVSGVLNSPLTNTEVAIVIPKTAVMWTGEKSVVYVKTTAKSGVYFLMRQIAIGASLGSSYVVVSGLEAGEEIATNGTFSIDAAAQLAGKPSMMNPGGGNSSTGHHHGDDSPSGAGDMAQNGPSNSEQVFEVGEEFRNQLKAVFEAYLPLKDALVGTDMAIAKKAAHKMLEEVEKVDRSLVKEDAHQAWMKDQVVFMDNIALIIDKNDIEIIRKYFSPLSDQLYHSLKRFQVNGINAYRQYCPMAFDFKGGFWLSSQAEIRNPYFGDAMLTCGAIKEEIK
jgi:Cu(I)/Ag(I) efflux system membrane fusion protein